MAPGWAKVEGYRLELRVLRIRLGAVEPQTKLLVRGLAVELGAQFSHAVLDGLAVLKDADAGYAGRARFEAGLDALY